MVNLLIYGIKQQAQQLCYYVESEGCAKVAAFVVDPEYKDITELNGRLVISFQEAVEQYPPTDYEFAVSFAYQHMVHDRREKMLKCKQAGYRLFTFISQHALCFAASVGEGNIIYPGCNIAYDVTIGDGNFFETGVTVAHHTNIGNWNFFAPAAVACGSVSIGENNFLGANCTVMDSGKIGNEVLVGAGAVVRETEDNGVYMPARTTKWHGTSGEIKI